MTRRLYLTLALVLFAASLLAIVTPARAQDSAETGKSKTDNNVTDSPFNFPEAQGLVKLRPAHGTRITLKLNDSSRAIYESIGKQARIDVLFDPDYTPRTMSVDLSGVSLQDALKMVAFESRTFWRPVTSNAIFVAADNTGKRREFEQQVFKAFYFPDVRTPTDLQDIVNSIRTIVEVQRIQQFPSQQTILVRATPEQLALTERMVEELTLSKEKTSGQYRLEYKISETGEERKGGSRTYTLLVEPHQTAKLRIGPPLHVREISEKEKIYLDLSRNIECQIRYEAEHTVSLHLTVGFPDVGGDEHGATDSAHHNPDEQATIETTVTLELEKATTIGSFQDPASKRSFQIEATATRAKSKE